MKNFTASNFKGACTCDEDFVPVLQKMNDIAVEHEIIVVVTSSFRQDTSVSGAIVTPAKASNHLVGHAIDCNLMHGKDYFNSKEMQNDVGPDHDFVTDCVAAGIRWGGNFNTKDPVHFDDGLNIHNPELWKQKYDAIHGHSPSFTETIQNSHL